MIKVILDTNFLLIPYQFNIDIFSEIDRIILKSYKLHVVDKTIDELNNLIDDPDQKQKDKKAARLALQLIDKKDINIIKTTSDEYVDDILIGLSNKDTIIATQDIALRAKLKAKNSQMIIMRAKSHLILI